jgi:hypothetical protein
MSTFACRAARHEQRAQNRRARASRARATDAGCPIVGWTEAREHPPICRPLKPSRAAAGRRHPRPPVTDRPSIVRTRVPRLSSRPVLTSRRASGPSSVAPSLARISRPLGALELNECLEGRLRRACRATQVRGSKGRDYRRSAKRGLQRSCLMHRPEAAESCLRGRRALASRPIRKAGVPRMGDRWLPH